MEASATFIQMLFNLFLWGVIVLVLRKAFRYPYRIKTSNRNLAFFLILIFCLYPFWGGDYFHYREMYNIYRSGGFIPLEEVYKWIIDNLSYSYLVFRFIVWGLALFLLFKAYRRVEVPFDLCFAIFASMFLIWFSYARVSLAMALIIIGLTFIIKPYGKSSILSFILGLCLILSSEFFHRSAVIGIIAALGALFLINADKKRIILVGLLFPLAILLLTKLLNEFMMAELDYDSFISQNQRDGYLNDNDYGRHSRGLGELISNFLTRTPIFITALLYIYLVFKNKFKILPKQVRYIASYSFIIVLIAVSFSFDLGFNTYVFYYRTLTFAMIPSAVFLSSVKAMHIEDRISNLIIMIGVAGVFYTLLYSTYCSLVA